jgi:hypothetical protein
MNTYTRFCPHLELNALMAEGGKMLRVTVVERNEAHFT